MKLSLLLLSIVSLFMSSCVYEKVPTIKNLTPENRVLLLKVDYITNTFEGGKEFNYSNQTSTFTIRTEYQSPGDFGGIQLYYQELNSKLFDGSIVWAGLGHILYPTSFLPPSAFNTINTLVAVPQPFFENVFNPNNTIYTYDAVWSSVAYLEKVNQYRSSNPNATVKIFLYTPSVGIGNPSDWKWILVFKN